MVLAQRLVVGRAVIVGRLGNVTGVISAILGPDPYTNDWAKKRGLTFVMCEVTTSAGKLTTESSRALVDLDLRLAAAEASFARRLATRRRMDAKGAIPRDPVRDAKDLEEQRRSGFGGLTEPEIPLAAARPRSEIAAPDPPTAGGQEDFHVVG